MPTDAKVAPKSCLGAFEVLVVVFLLKNFYGKNGHGALVGLKYVKATSADDFFQFFCFLKLEKVGSGTCRSYLN